MCSRAGFPGGLFGFQGERRAAGELGREGAMSPALLLFAALLLLEIAHRLACDRPVRTPFLAIAVLGLVKQCRPSEAGRIAVLNTILTGGLALRSWRACGSARQRLRPARPRCRSRPPCSTSRPRLRKARGCSACQSHARGRPKRCTSSRRARSPARTALRSSTRSPCKQRAGGACRRL